jgi:hypothetical protein
MWIMLTSYYVWLLLVRSKHIYFSWARLARDVFVAASIGFTIAFIPWYQNGFGDAAWFCGFTNHELALKTYAGMVLSVLVVAGYFYTSTIIRVYRVRKLSRSRLSSLAIRLLAFIIACIVQWAGYLVFLMYKVSHKQVNVWFVYAVIFLSNCGGVFNSLLYARLLGQHPSRKNYVEKGTENSTMGTTGSVVY